MNDIKVSICTLSYNQKDYIAQCLEGMLSQKCDFDFEILIHDDASTDGTDSIIRYYCERYPDIIKPVYETENQYSKDVKNISGVYNFPRVSGKYIAMCEGDDYWNDDHKLQRQVDYMDAHPECSMCFHSAYQESTGVAISKKLMRPYHGDRTIVPVKIISKKVSYPTASLMMRADIFKSLPEFYMQAPIGDIPMQLICANAGKAYYIDMPMCTYRYMADGSWTSDMRKGDYTSKQKMYASQMQAMYDSFDRYSDRKYHDTIEDAKNRLVFRVGVNIRDWDEIYSRENRKYLRELGPFENVMLVFERSHPKMYSSLQSRFVKK